MGDRYVISLLIYWLEMTQHLSSRSIGAQRYSSHCDTGSNGSLAPQPRPQPSPTNLQNAHSTGSITQSIQRTRQVAGFTLLINVECQSEAEADEAIAAGANIVMLDNLVGDELHGTAKRLKDKWRGKREFLIETSGGIVEDGLVARLGPDVDVLSTSAVHQVSDIRGTLSVCVGCRYCR